MLKTVMKFEFGRTVNKLSFWVRTLSLPLLIVALISLSYFSGKAVNQADQKAQQSQFTIAIQDDSGYLSPALLGSIHAKIVTDRSAGIQLARTGKIDAFIYYPANPVVSPLQVYAKDDGLTNNGKYEATATSLLQAGLVASIGAGDKVTLLQHAPATSLVTYKNGEETKGFGRAIVPALFLVLFYAVIVLMGTQMLTSTTEEKENRVIEMILISVSARTIIIGKILSLIALGVVQFLAIMVPVTVGYFGFRSQLNIPAIDLNQLSFAPMPIIVGALIFAGGFLLFTGLLVAIGAAVPTAKDASGFFGVAMILIFVPFYAFGAIVSSPDQIIVQVMSYFPLTAPITLMLRNAAGNLSPLEALLGITVVLVSGAALLALAIRIFRFGSIEYGRRLGVKEILSRHA